LFVEVEYTAFEAKAILEAYLNDASGVHKHLSKYYDEGYLLPPVALLILQPLLFRILRALRVALLAQHQPTRPCGPPSLTVRLYHRTHPCGPD
jgi:hypothetical protein